MNGSIAGLGLDELAADLDGAVVDAAGLGEVPVELAEVRQLAQGRGEQVAGLILVRVLRDPALGLVVHLPEPDLGGRVLAGEAVGATELEIGLDQVAARAVLAGPRLGDRFGHGDGAPEADAWTASNCSARMSIRPSPMWAW